MRNSPIELELFRQILVSIADEMGVVLRRTAFSPNIKERRDYSCAVYDSRGETIAMGDHMPVHLGAMPLSVRSVIESIRLQPGDVAILNDPFRGGTHLPDITAVARASPLFYVASRAHHSDVGGMSPGSMPLATEIYQEGLRIPPILLVQGGQIRQDVLDLLLANVRTPVERAGDLTAQIRALDRGRVRLQELTEKYGAARVVAYSASLRRYSEAMMRRTLVNIGDGDYGFEDYLDPGYLIRAKISLRAGRALIDFTGTCPQASEPVNANYAICVSAVLYVFRCLIGEDVPSNAGLLKPLRIVAPAGTLVNALPPAAMAAGNVETSQRITDVLLGALAKAAPDRIPAASAGTMSNLSFGGVDSARERRYSWYETIAGGMGAGPRGAGHDATHTHMTNSWNTPVEAFEHQYPVRVTRYEIRRGSGGAGLHRGGDGIVRELEFLEDAEVTLLADRRGRGPWGLQGGEPGAPGKASRNDRGLPARVRFQAAAGDRLRIESPGGGGWGRVIMKSVLE